MTEALSLEDRLKKMREAAVATTTAEPSGEATPGLEDRLRRLRVAAAPPAAPGTFDFIQRQATILKNGAVWHSANLYDAAANVLESASRLPWGAAPLGLSELAFKVAKDHGVDPGQLNQRGANYLRSLAASVRKVSDDPAAAPKNLPEQIVRAVGAAPFEIMEQAIAWSTGGPVGNAILAAAQVKPDEPGKQLLEGTKGLITGGVFRAMERYANPLPGSRPVEAPDLVHFGEFRPPTEPQGARAQIAAQAQAAGKPSPVTPPPGAVGKLPPDVSADFGRWLQQQGAQHPDPSFAPRADFQRFMRESSLGAPKPPPLNATPKTVALLEAELPKALPSVTDAASWTALRDKVMTALQGPIDQARRGVRPQVLTMAEAEQIAKDAGTGVKELGWKAGQAYNAEDLTARRLIKDIARQDFLGKAQLGLSINPADKAEFASSANRYYLALRQFAGGRAEAGRALNILRTDAAKVQDKELLNLLGAEGGADRVEFLAKAVQSLKNNPDALPGLVTAFKKPTLLDKFIEAYINLSLLSGPQSLIKNAAGNSIVTIWSAPERLSAAAISHLPGGSGEIGVREAAAKMTGVVRSWRVAARDFWGSLLTEETQGGSKIDTGIRQAIGGTTGQVIRSPGRGLNATDVFFKGLNYGSELEALAVRDGLKHGVRGQALRNRVAETLTAPPDAMAAQAWNEAERATFTNRLGGNYISDTGQAAISYLEKNPYFKLLIPFVRTPTNIADWSFKRTPLAFTFRDIQAELNTKGAVRDLALGRIAFGTMVGGLSAYAAAEGRITGALPSDPEERALWKSKGIQEYSIKIPGTDKWASYKGLDPLASNIGASADLARVGQYMTRGELDKAGALIVASVASMSKDKLFLDTLNHFVQAVENPDRYMAPFISRFLGAVAVPNIAAQIARANDPYVRDARTLLDTVQARIPVLSKSLAAKADLFGQDIVRESTGSMILDVLNPAWLSTEKNDKVISEMIRLVQAGTMTAPQMPSRKIGGIEMTPQQYRELVITAGRPAKQILDMIANTPSWDAMNDGAKADTIASVIADFRSGALAQLTAGNPELQGNKMNFYLKRYGLAP